MGISAATDGHGRHTIAFAVRNAIHLIDIGIVELGSKGDSAVAAEIPKYLQSYERENDSKIIAAGISSSVAELCPSLCSRLWLDCDVLPFVIPKANWTNTLWHEKRIDEQADSMARRCLM